MSTRACVAIAAAALLVGCSALQIDVDVYKGPLVNEDSMQRDQMLAMAMSAKVLMLSMRNKILDDHACGWDEGGSELRRKTLEFEKLVSLETETSPPALSEACRKRLAEAEPSSYGSAAQPQRSSAVRRQLIRNARQLNSILSFYDDRDDTGLKPLLDQVRQRQEALDDKRRAYLVLATPRSPPSPEAEKAYGDMRLAAGGLYVPMVRLLQTAAGARLASSQERLKIIEKLARDVVDITDPLELFKAAACFSADPASPATDLIQRADQLDPGVFVRSRSGDRTRWYADARRALLGALKDKPRESAEALLLANQARRQPSPPDSCSALARQPRPEGIVRRLFPDERIMGDEADDNTRQIGDIVNTVLATLGESGFDRGRIENGIDSLADIYAATRDSSAGPGRKNGRTAAEQLSQQQFARLDHLLVDMAQRMQFLATNLWLIDERGGKNPADNEIERFKALLESIATNIIVHADDLRRQSVHNEQQSTGGAIDRSAANRVFAVDPGAAFTRIEKRIGEFKLKAVADEAAAGGSVSLASLQKEKSRLETALEEEGKAVKSRRDEALDATALLVTVVPGQAPSPLLLATSADAPKLWSADRESVRKALAASTGNASVEALRLELDAWLVQELAGLSSPALKDDPRAARLRSARQMVERLAPLSKAELKRSAAYAELRRIVLAKYQSASKVSLNESGLRNLQRELDSIKVQLDAEQRRITRLTASGAGVPSAGYDAILKIVNDARSEVLGMTASSMANPDGNLIMGFLRLSIERAMDKLPAEQRADHLNALTVLKRVGNPAEPQAAQQTHEKAIEVLDSVIGQLRFLHIDAIRSKGRNSEEAKDIEAALTAARRQREDHIYVRPASSYLRSVYAATYTQPSSRTEWRNMLVEQFRNITKPDAATDRIKEDLDKAYWQNINTVRLAASGSSNFVVAKDDVGNWYVKAMGSDPAAMIKAAKQLALYNLGSQMDSNLLRVDELRNTIDARRANGEAPDEGLQSELNALTGGQSGAAVTARSQTLKLFKQNYDELSLAQLKDMQARLTAREFVLAIAKRWSTTLEKASDPKALDAAFDNAEVKQRLQDAELAASQGVAAGSATGSAMVSVLQALSRARSTLKAVVQTTVALTNTEVTNAAAAVTAVASAQATLDARNAEVDAAAEQIKLKETERTSAIDKGDATAKERADVALDEARKTYAGRVEAARLASKEVTEKRRLLAEANVALNAAKSRQEEAARDVDAVLKTAIDEAVARRLRVVDETETAVKVIGRTGS